MRIFSSLFKTAGWVIQGANNRASFQERILNLYAAWDDLLGSIRMSVSNRTYKLSFTPLEECTFSKDYMINVYGALLDAGRNSESKDTTSTIIGTISLGISIERTKMYVDSEDASSISHTEATILRSAMKAQVVSVADLERALAGERFPTDFDSYTPSREESNKPAASSSTTSNWIPPVNFNQLFRRGDSTAGIGTPPHGDNTKENFADIKSELEGCRKELEQRNHDLQQAIGENRVYARNVHELQDANARLKEHLLSSQKELTNVQRKLDVAKVLANTRGRELQGAQVFLAKADSIAISDLSPRVTQLNEEIFQAAASLGEAVCRRQWILPDEEAIRCIEDASRLIGPHLVFATREHAKNPEAPVHPFLVQVVLQVFLNTFCVEKIRMWAPSEPIHDDYIRSLYQAIWEKGKTANKSFHY